jgi:opacity protein-like surface antigen
MKKIALVIALAIASLNAAQAQTAPAEKQMRFLVGGGLTFGGDKLATAEYTNGGEIDIHAGSMIALNAGMEYRFAPEFSLQANVGYHVDNASATNGDIRFQRFPMELLGYYHANQQWRVGGGVRYVSNPKLSSSGAAYFGNFDFKNTVSGVVEVEYLMNQHVGFKVRYVNEKFELKNGTKEFDANHVGFFANYYF